MLLAMASMNAQTTREELKENINKTGGVYYAYPTSVAENTPAPKGYEPFYISHYGRHGSRYLISDNDYRWVLELMRKAKDANALTPLGQDVLSRIEQVWQEAEGRGGDLSPLGVRQHRGIAERMAAAYPQVFKGDVEISARSTIVTRCVLSMDAFCERLKEINPNLKITRESSNRYMNYLNYHSSESNAFTGDKGPWREEYRKFEETKTNGDRLVNSIFSDKDYVKKNINPHSFMWGMYWITVGMQDIETKVSFYDIFTADELIDLWECFNYHFYVCDSNYAGNKGLVLGNAKNLLRNIIESADEAINSGKNSATLRFGHDGNLIPLAGILRIENCYNSVMEPEHFMEAFSDFKIAPMAGNIQIVFFKNKKSGDVIVKFLLNEQEKHIPVETDMWPYYKWEDVRSYYMSLLSE
jgi:hypothetical protein